MELQRWDGLGVLFIDSPNNNAIDQHFIQEANRLIDEAASDASVAALVATARHPRIFCPGLNLMALTRLSYAEMLRFIDDLTGLIHKKFAFPKPMVEAINGHAIAGGCLMAMEADYRFMAKGKFQIGLVEIDLAIPIPVGSMAVLDYAMGRRNVERMVYSGQNLSPEQALELGLVDELAEPGELMEKAVQKARFLASKPAVAFRRDKEYLRKAALEWMKAREPHHLKEWVDCWFSKEAQESIAQAMERLTKK